MSEDLKYIFSCWMKQSADGLFECGLAGWGVWNEKCLCFSTGADFSKLKIGTTREKYSKKSNHQPFGTDEDGPLHSSISP